MKRLNTLLLLTIFCSLTSYGQTLNVAKLDSFFNSLEARDLAFGSLSISKNGIIQYQRCIGYSFIDNDTKIPANINTKYRIGSVSKMFTAVMVFQLIEEGKVSLNQKLNLYFPTLPNANKITISNLLNHRSGLHNYTENTNFQEWMDKPVTHEELLKIITEKGADFEPDTKAEYNNTNYLLLSYIVEKVCGMPYKDALKKRITAKIGLQNTYYGTPIDVTKNESSSYKYHANSWNKVKETDLSIHVGAGSVVSTPTDMVKFIEALFAYKLVGKSSLNNMKTLIDGIGMGMFPFEHRNKMAYGHGGRIEEFYSRLQYFPNEKLTIAYITNGILYPRPDILDGILKICFNEPFTLPIFKTNALTTENLDKYSGKYSSKQLPFIVSVTKNDTNLLLEAQGKTFEVEQINDNYFMHLPTGYFFDFHPEKNELQIKETDNIYYLKREK